ncbi:hypothetical protein AB0M79_28655 [Polymorphospora sp. NPDC051019]|uniref:hypothetical protein n=1 Tax=Polymorphospora sp. NPDC051019 TaxID=3155725 RepID=UPI003436BBDA
MPRVLLRREGMYSSHIVEWRRARDAGALAGVGDKPRRPARGDADREAERLRVENERLRTELARTRAALDVVGKVPSLLFERARSGLKMITVAR